MGPRDPAIISDAISRFLQVAQEREYAEKISSFEETIKSHQADNARLQDHHNQEISSLKANVKSLQASTKKSEVDRANLQDHHSQEISSLQTIVKSLRGSTKNAEAGIAKLQDHHNREDNTLSGVLKSLEGFVEQEADNNQLRDEIAELRAQLGHTGDISAGGGEAPGAHRLWQSGTQLQEPSKRQSLHSRFVRNIDEQQLLPQRETKANLQLPPLNGHSHNRGPQPSRPPAHQYPRGIKRTHVDDTAEPPHRPTAAEEADNPHGFEQPQRQEMHQAKRSDHKRVHDEMPSREENRQSQLKDRGKVRHDKFVAYYHSLRREHKKNNHGKDQSAFIRHFINGIPDPDYLCWFQEALKELFPGSVQDAKWPGRIPGNRTITLKKNLTWEDVKTVVKDIPIPYFAD